MGEVDQNQQQAVSFHQVRRGTSVLVLNCAENRLIAAGQQNFQMLSIEQLPHTVQFNEICDFRSMPKQSGISRYALQPKDVAWSQQNENCFATASSTSGQLYIWDATRLDIVSQYIVHQTIINRLQFHSKNPYLLLTASQDGYAKLIDIRIGGSDPVAASFRHSSKDAFRDIDINQSNTEKFAAVINDQYSVPIWDIRQPAQPDFSVLTRDKVLCVAWNPLERSWLATGGIGRNGRTICIWDAIGNDSRQEPLFTVHTFGQVTKFSWRPTCRYHIASFTRTTDHRIHVWDIRRAYLPQSSFCHHRNDIGDFLWRPNSDNLISADRDECLVHAHYSSAMKSDQLVSLFSLNVTSTGSVHIAQPNIDNEYIRALHNERRISPSSSSAAVSVGKSYLVETIAKFVKWDRVIEGRSILGIYTNPVQDDSVRLFHQFARRWSFGSGTKSLPDLEYLCDMNSFVAEDLNRPDLKATWQVIKMLYVDRDHSKKRQVRSSRTSRSLTRSFRVSDFMGAAGQHHYSQQTGKTLIDIDEQQQDFLLNGQSGNENNIMSQEKRILLNSKLAMMDEMDTYIVRDVLTDDILFVSPDDLLDNGNSMDGPHDYHSDIEAMRGSFSLPITSSGTPNNDNDHNDISTNRIMGQFRGIVAAGDNQLGTDDEYDDMNINMQTAADSGIFDGIDHFPTIDENYCPTRQEHSLNFDLIIRETLLYYIENNDLQMAVHLLLALYPQLTEQKRIELFNGAHLQWLVMYIELLQKMRLFVKAKQVTKHCLEKEGIPLNYNTAAFDGTIILAEQTAPLARSSSRVLPLASLMHNNGTPVLKEFVCSICRIPCRGLFSFCGVCFHGGHIKHIDTWFEKHDECSYGCGHRCRDLVSQNHRTRTVQRLMSKTSFTAQN